MSSFTVFYEGQKKSVKLANANVLLQQVVVEAAEHFQLNPADCSLRHKGKTVDISMPLRFCTFPNNAALDLIVNRRSATTGTGPASKVALSVSAGDQTLNLSAVLSSSNSLKDMIAYFVEKNQLAGDILAGRFELIYMRSCFNSLDALQSTTLASLGLAGQAARFQLRILDAIPFAKSQSTASSSSSSANAGAEVVPILPPAATPAATPTSPLATEPATDHQSPTTMALPIPPLSSMNHISAVASEAAVDPHEMEVEEQSEVTEVLSPKDSIALLLSTNFDVATKPAITTLYKYIANISYYPHEEKYKTINTANKVFLDKVAPARNIEQVFLAFGFEKIVSGHWKLIEASKEVNAVERRINEALTAINNAMDELQIPEEERPKVNPPVVQSSTPFEFDPFKSLLVRNAIQPTRDISTTDIKLEQLQKRRRELEGSPEMVQRETEAVFPAGPSSSSNSASTVLENGSSSDAGGVSKSIMQKILKGEEEAPLTTKAVRDLQKAQTERIHSRTLIRIRFPDKVQLLGYFHPRNTVADVYVWIASAMHAFATQSFTDIENSAQQAFEHFELYTSPPRTVLPPFQSMPKKTKRSPSLEDSSFLIDLNLVPAAVIHLSWKSAMVHRNAETGGYLRDDLVAVAIQQGAYAGSSKSIPQGVHLVEKATDKKASESEEQIMSSLDGKIESKADEKASSKVSKPKWFKL